MKPLFISIGMEGKMTEETYRPMLCVSVLMGILLLSGPFVWSSDDAAHHIFNDILRDHVSDGQVDYSGIATEQRFADYVKTLASARTFTDKETALAYWINAYNALAIKGILDGRSPSSLFGRLGYFKVAKYHVGGKKINLYDLERKVIIPLGETRIHFAINCASVSCPKLLSAAYTPETLNDQLETRTRTFINDPARNRFDPDNQVAYVSKIFHWFKQEFRDNAGSVQRYLARYVDDPQVAQHLKNDAYRIKYLSYDWRLNGTPPPAGTPEG